MSIFSPLLSADRAVIDLFSEKMKVLYERMSASYDRSASCYGFSCRGCDENCCEERFYHHTLSEFVCLLGGLRSCDDEKRKEIFRRAGEVAGLYRMHDMEGQARRVLCPLNNDGMCGLYEYRLMICRLHGVPYRMKRPDNTEAQGSGCHRVAWDMSPEKNAECMLDRTELYRQLSAIEIELRQKIGFSHRIRMTIAGMIVEAEELLRK